MMVATAFALASPSPREASPVPPAEPASVPESGAPPPALPPEPPPEPPDPALPDEPAVPGEPPAPPLPPVDVVLVVAVVLATPPAPPVAELDVVLPLVVVVLVVGLAGAVSSELHPPNATRAAAVDDRRTIEAYLMVMPFCDRRLARSLQGRRGVKHVFRRKTPRVCTKTADVHVNAPEISRGAE